MKNKLETYRGKRDFHKTQEPTGGERRGDGQRFVIQKHDASRLHYDFRLELGGVLASWAVPKGLSTDPRAKRLAIQTEDHPLAYCDFEGVIPEGEYGAGTVIIWDVGTYRNLRAHKGRHSQNMEDSLEEGMIEVWLEGRKLHGGYALKRIQGGEKSRWLIIKMDDQHADAGRKPTDTEPDSATSGRDLKTVAKEEAKKHG